MKKKTIQEHLALVAAAKEKVNTVRADADAFATDWSVISMMEMLLEANQQLLLENIKLAKVIKFDKLKSSLKE